MGRLKITTKSFAGNCALFRRKLSLIILLIKFRSTERFTFRFTTTIPKREIPSVFSLDNTVKASLLNFVGRSKTCLKWLAVSSLSRLVNVKSSSDKNYGHKSTRPFARRAFMTARPLLVFILALNPWVRARFRLLG